MSSLPLTQWIVQSLANRPGQIFVEDGASEWRLTGEEILAGAALLFRELKPYVDRPLIAYFRKSPLYYAFTACCFIYRLNFCPVDINNPARRVLDIAAQLPNPLILCDDVCTLAKLQDFTTDCLLIQLYDQQKVFRDDDAICSDSRDASYYIATSGSTGAPKLVKVPHDRTLPFIAWAIPFYRVDQSCRWAQFSSIGFDLSLVDFLTVVCGGGTLISLSTDMDRLRPAKAILRQHITHWHSVPSLIPYFLRDTTDVASSSTCRVFTFCGEALMRADADQLAVRYPASRIVNTYGPTEATLFCSFFEYVSTDRGLVGESVPVGQPIPSWNFVLVPHDGALRLVIISDNISDGYVGVSSPLFSTISLFGREMRAFDSGDYFTMVGSHLYFSHRRDGMVKIHGNRIDLGEIEAAAKKVGLVNPVAVASKGSIAIIAEGEEQSVTDMTAELLNYLPRSMAPSFIRFVQSHPRTITGKLDRKAICEAFGDVS